MSKSKIDEVIHFWDKNPLFTGEGELNDAFFAHHDQVYHEDVLFHINIAKTFCFPSRDKKILDLGCGVGFWAFMFNRLGYKDITAADISKESIKIAKKRVKNSKNVYFYEENAEQLSFGEKVFDHVNCQGVVHHTPHTDQAIKEIYRILKDGGTASVSVYYDNWIIRNYKFIRYLTSPLFSFFGNNMGRGRNFSLPNSKEELIRLYDGSDNPIGKSYSHKEFITLCENAGFKKIDVKFFFFPFRFLKIKFPRIIKILLLKMWPFMIVCNCKK